MSNINTNISSKSVHTMALPNIDDEHTVSDLHDDSMVIALPPDRKRTSTNSIISPHSGISQNLVLPITPINEYEQYAVSPWFHHGSISVILNQHRVSGPLNIPVIPLPPPEVRY